MSNVKLYFICKPTTTTKSDWNYMYLCATDLGDFMHKCKIYISTLKNVFKIIESVSSFMLSCLMFLLSASLIAVVKHFNGYYITNVSSRNRHLLDCIVRTVHNVKLSL